MDPISESRLEALAAYLARSGGRDVLECTDAEGRPDALGARRMAEALRAQFGDHLGRVVAVEQQANRVVLVLARQPARI
jgi:hypothetical protein